MVTQRIFCVHLLIFSCIILAKALPSKEVIQTEDEPRIAGITRVVGGWNAQEYQFPHVVSIRMVSRSGEVSSCGGSLIHQEWVMTAAHCLRSRYLFVVRIGSLNLTEPAFITETNRRFVHPGYLETSTAIQTDDIGLLGLETSVPYSRRVQPLRLQNSEEKDLDYSNQVLIVSGFGYTDDVWNGGEASEVLRWTYLQGISQEQCRSQYPTTAAIRDETICAVSYNETSQSACQEDSGGPLTLLDFDGQPTLVGVFSFGSSAGCNSPWPTAYVRPGYYHEWIRQVTGINFDWRRNGNSWSIYEPTRN